MWATHILFKLPGFNCVSLVASPPLLKYLPTPLVGNPIIKILDTPLDLLSAWASDIIAPACMNILCIALQAERKQSHTGQAIP